MYAHRHHPTPLTRLVHVLLLLGWLFSSHGVAPAICMAAALMDGDHAVKVGLSKEGALTVVLSHDGKSPAELTQHEHDALCRVLVAFAVTPESAGADHILAFKPVDDASRTLRLLSSTQGNVSIQAPMFILARALAQPPAANCAAGRVLGRVWSQGLAMKSGRTVMRC
jgi:hypothetical protein